jgi:hypothetical protein
VTKNPGAAPETASRKFFPGRANGSIDAYGPLNDYSRHPAKWTQLAHNLDIIDRSYGELNLGRATLSVTVQIYNIFHLHELIEYCQGRFKFIRTIPNLVHLSIPDYFNVQHLPADLKQRAAERLKALKTRLVMAGETDGLNQIDSVLTYQGTGEHSPYLMSEFKRVTVKFDKLRGESITDLVPELRPIMEVRADNPEGWFRLAASRARWLGGKIRNRLLG